VDAVVDAIRVFFEHLAAVQWRPLAIALSLHLLRLVLRTLGWRSILVAAYPSERVRWRTVLGAYFAGVGVNAITPARGGDVVKLYLVKRGIPGSSYATLAATLVVETLFDFVVAGLLLLWAVQQGVLPGFSVLERLPSFDWAWFVRHPRFSLGLGLVAVVVAVVLVSRATKAFRHRFAEGFAILRSPKRYVATVVSWQAASWVCRIASTYFFLRAFGLAPDLRDAFVVQVVQSLATLLPFTPGGIGTEQGLLVYAFRGEAPATAVVSFSVGMHLAIVAANVALGFAALALMLRTVRWRRVVATGEEPA
jgi:glycosyltransferase 2 family protein